MRVNGSDRRDSSGCENRSRKTRCVLTGVADEGGWGPRLESNELALQLLTWAIEVAGFRPGADISIAIDVASSHFFKDDAYHSKRKAGC